MLESRINEEYFEWLYSKVCDTSSRAGGEPYDRFSEGHTFRKLLEYLHSVEFTWELPMDGNRAEDGISLRHHFTYEMGYDDCVADYIEGPCSVLEMMVALADSMENIMDDPRLGDRTGQWFWAMVVSLGLNGMYDRNFKERVAEDAIDRFLRREYRSDGRGGLFTIRRCPHDLRDVDILVQRNWYLNNLD